MAIDRRVRRTKSLLHRALIELMLERGYDRVTVRDILARADVGRSTFYAHFRDKDDLLVVSSTEYLRAAVAASGAVSAGGAAPLAPIATLFGLAAANREVYRALLGPKSSGLLLRATQVMVAEVLTEQLAGRLDMSETEFAATVTFLAWGVVGLLGAITESEPPLPPAEAYDRLEMLVGPGLSGRVRTPAR
ncbi:TetR/AcrR family transcriptional regulator [Nocardia sp. NPDC052566]|uniref:TetR/AcrR family transcriptional regulator n=1 Tax=Nocardia sp. NPDC052566 TaxID=3364330 RepID=UPI0037C9220C